MATQPCRLFQVEAVAIGHKLQKLAIYGAGGFGREVLPMVRAYFNAQCDLVFVDDDAALVGKRLNGIPVYSLDQALAEERLFSLALADPQTRKAKAKMLEERGVKFFQAQSKETVIYDEVESGEGAILCSNVIVTSNIKIGRHFHANFHSYIAHDCVIGDYVTVAPHVSFGGRLVVGDGVYFGAGAVIKQGTAAKALHIGEGAVIGMGAVVTKDVPPGATMIGNPARLMEKK